MNGLQLVNWRITYSPLDVETEIRKMVAWLDANPRRRKRNYKRFIVGWLNKAHEQETARMMEAQKLTKVGTSGRFVDYSKDCADILKRHPELA